MLYRMLRFLLLRFLPRRLVPLLLLLDVIRLVRRWQTRDARVIDGHAVVVPPRALNEPSTVDRR
jgi:hypothetical protein